MCKKNKHGFSVDEVVRESCYGKCSTCKRQGVGQFCGECEKQSKYLFDWRGFAMSNKLFPYTEVA